jgi:hypothetical protein
MRLFQVSKNTDFFGRKGGSWATEKNTTEGTHRDHSGPILAALGRGWLKKVTNLAVKCSQE